MRTSTSRPGPQGWYASLCAVALAALALGAAPAGGATTVPGAPTITSATAGRHSVTVTYSAPSNDGGKPITDYRVACTSSDAGVSRSRTGHVSPIRVTGLSAAKTYTCDVEARNRAGYGPASAESAPVVTFAAPPSPTVPGAPTISSATPGVRSVSVGFAAPASDGGAKILEYRVACTSSDGGVNRSRTRRTSPIRVALTASKTYTCDVKAKNRVGFGAPSALLAPFVTLAPPVVTVPGAPTITSAVAGNHDVTVAFSAPAASDGAPIFEYKATCTSSDGGVARSNRRGRSSIRVGGLTSAKTYTCTVAAKNRKGFGAESAPSAAVVTLQN
ncbi:MAG: fibronectin type III domain-containing protein [Acidimicrobiia bacterium]